VKAIHICILITWVCYPAYSQLNKVDSLALTHAVHAAKQSYFTTIASNSKVYNGQEYIIPFKDKKVMGDPYYLDYDWQEGQVLYDSQLYDQVPLRYDLFEDKLLIEYGQGYESVELKKEKLNYFKINDQLFVRLFSADQSEIKEGFYEQLYAGAVCAYAKRYKTIREIMDQDIMQVAYVEKQKYFLKQDEHYYSISHKKDLIKVFIDHKSEIKKFLVKQNLNFKQNPERTLILVSEYYEQLNGHHE
jgi:hypothetical protein